MEPEEWERFMCDNPLWWAVQKNVKCLTLPIAKKAPDADLRLMSALENGRRMKEYLEKNPPLRKLRKDEPIPIEYDDPIKQAAFEMAYKDRRWMLRVPADYAQT